VSWLTWLFWLFTLNSCLNPFIYLAFNPELINTLVGGRLRRFGTNGGRGVEAERGGVLAGRGGGQQHSSLILRSNRPEVRPMQVFAANTSEASTRKDSFRRRQQQFAAKTPVAFNRGLGAPAGNKRLATLIAASGDSSRATATTALTPQEDIQHQHSHHSHQEDRL